MASSLDGRSSAVDPVPPVPACCGRPVISTRLQRFRSGGGTVYHVVVASRPKQVWQARVLGSKKGSDKPRSPFSADKGCVVGSAEAQGRGTTGPVSMLCSRRGVGSSAGQGQGSLQAAASQLQKMQTGVTELLEPGGWCGRTEPAGRDVASDSQCISVNRATGAVLIFNSAWLCPYMSPWKKLENRMATRCGV